MILYSILVLTFVIFNESILAFPSLHSFESPSDPNSLLSRRLLSERSDKSVLSSYIKRAFFGRGKTQGVKCDSTFYKQSKVETLAQRLCQKEQNTKIKPGSKYSRIAHTNLANLFPQVRPTTLSMLRIKSSFFSANRIKNFLGMSFF